MLVYNTFLIPWIRWKGTQDCCNARLDESIKSKHWYRLDWKINNKIIISAYLCSRIGMVDYIITYVMYYTVDIWKFVILFFYYLYTVLTVDGKCMGREGYKRALGYPSDPWERVRWTWNGSRLIEWAVLLNLQTVCFCK